MSIPTYDKFIDPLLRYLAQHEYGVGVSHRLVKVPGIDRDYFEEVVEGNQ